MKRLILPALAFGLVACGAPTEPKLNGTYELVAVNGDSQGLVFDTTHCASVYENLTTYIALSGGANGGAHYYAAAHPYCNAQRNVWEDIGNYTLDGDQISIKFSRASVAQTGTLSANRDTLTMDLRDVFTIDNPETARFTFVRLQ